MREPDRLISPLDSAPSEVRNWVESLLPKIGKAFDLSKNGHLPEWREALDAIPLPSPDARSELDADAVFDGTNDEMDRDVWMRLHPWRKGPFRMGRLFIDTEWRSDWKWNRLKEHIEPLAGRSCLDVGCGNGYHLWRMRGTGARCAVGLDPFLLYVFQFLAVQKRIPGRPVTVLPLGAEAIPDGLKAFDTVFSMGVLYHCHPAASHLARLRQALRPGGQLVLETLTVPEAHGPVYRPKGRYAQMKRIREFPSVDRLMGWVGEAGFKDVRHVDTTVTTFHEQRATDWMCFHSLRDHLDPDDPDRTREGHPAPRRSIVTAFCP